MDDVDNFSFIPYLINSGSELKKFSENVNVLTAQALTQLQRMPITLRRRAASHNVKRLPFKFRKMATVSAAKRIIKTCRKYKRRHMDIRAIFATRQCKNKWLYTHVWHAKRFRIENKWGWRVPVVPNQKTFRPCTKAMLSGSAIVDISYYGMYELNGCLSKIIDGLKSLISVDETKDILEQLLNGREVYVVLHESGQYPYGAICPIKMMIMGDKASECRYSSILLSVHPAATTEVIAALLVSFNLQNKLNGCWVNSSDDIALIDRGGEICRYRLIGSDSHRILTTLLRGSDKIAVLSEWPLTQIVSGYSVEAIVVNPELCQPKLKQTDPEEWDRCPWRKRRELPPVARAQSSFQITEEFRQSFINGATVPTDVMKHLVPLVDGEMCPIRIIRHNYEGESPGGWDVIVPSKWAMKLWHAFIMKGCRPIGLNYWSRYCSVEVSSLVSKYDCYPMVGWADTAQGALDAHARAANLKGAWSRRPRAKRVNFKLQATDSPFQCPYDTLMKDDEGAIRPWFVLRHRLKLDRIVTPLLQGKVQATVSQLDRWDSQMRHCLVPVMVDAIKAMPQPFGVLMAAMAGDTAKTVLEQLVDQPPVRHVVGYTDTGDQSMVHAHGRGSGLVSLRLLVALSHGRPKTDLFWIKNPNQRLLLPVRLEVSS